MNDSKNKFLLSMLLAIRELDELDTPLNSQEKNNLYIFAGQLKADITAWGISIKPNLIELINNNPSLNAVFQDIKSKLEKIDNIPENLIPSQDELATVIPIKIEPLQRPIIKLDASYLKSNEITNMSIQILSSPQPSKTAKKISKLEQLLNFIRQNRSDNK
ncbi:MAG: hypothetical protein F6K25_21310 [Okeania sp. SIO2G4]|uniref:hypothetical protein n=1 Tax=unclassified Okeania TaxID=2634635 RepID=UPI0013B90E56|nr:MULTISPECIES: hypothetical protein [unclassified Okeania]NEP08582.1 hypothetical protein [Okeania sp. SIO4D6]NEP47222.1 hypothetical protein [Okeania sp. SIO2H7]NEP74325.1 hypothetical protein [Okeania sp. SIO2G5]NEP95401.1 hypothetical protein [Okeania sp. SIO2F5]NEQ93063.1 hypothetical protein [Okeania sp. SIO2G4]